MSRVPDETATVPTDAVDVPVLLPAQRLFLALWPEIDLQHELQALAAPRLAGLDCRPVHPADLHLTLHFAGHAAAAQRDALLDLCAELPARAFTLKLAPLEWWHGSKSVVLAASETAPSQALALVERLAAGAERLGLQKRGSPWRPHVTLARQVKLAADGKAPVLAPIRKLEWKAKRFCLAESLAGVPAGQPRYRVLARWALD